jgi:pSer/pThr/pTyr-binding forkhead associated (FHA) protein
VAERQSDALYAYRRLKTNLTENLGIDPGPTIRTLHDRILRQERLNTTETAPTTATHGVVDSGLHTGTLAGPSAIAELCANDGQRYRLESSNRIGRRPDNDIVLDDDDVSRYHAVVIDTGSEFVISDLRSTNGVVVAGRRIRGSATLADGDRIRIGNHEFAFEIRAR